MEFLSPFEAAALFNDAKVSLPLSKPSKVFLGSQVKEFTFGMLHQPGTVESGG